MELEASHLLSAGLHPVLSQAAWLKDFGREAAASFLNIRNSPACQGRGVQAWLGIRCLLPWRVVLKQHAGVSARHCNTACPCNRGDIIALHHCGKPVQDTPQSFPSLWYRRERRKAFVAFSLNQLPPHQNHYWKATNPDRPSIFPFYYVLGCVPQSILVEEDSL